MEKSGQDFGGSCRVEAAQDLLALNIECGVGDAGGKVEGYDDADAVWRERSGAARGHGEGGEGAGESVNGGHAGGKFWRSS